MKRFYLLAPMLFIFLLPWSHALLVRDILYANPDWSKNSADALAVMLQIFAGAFTFGVAMHLSMEKNL